MPEAEPNVYTVLIRGEPVGTIRAARRDPYSVEGAFVPGPGLGPYRAEFEAAVGACRQFGASCRFDEATGSGACDFTLWDRYDEACEEITQLGLRLAELCIPVSEFKVREDWTVQVIFDAARAEPGAVADGGGMIRFWDFKHSVAPAAAELGRSAEEPLGADSGQAFPPRSGGLRY